MSYTVTIMPGKMLTFNAALRMNRQELARHTRELREAAYWAAAKAKLPRNIGPTVITVEATHKRKADVCACAPMVKGIVDGLVDWGCWSDDSPEHVRAIMFESPKVGQPSVTVTLTVAVTELF